MVYFMSYASESSNHGQAEFFPLPPGSVFMFGLSEKPTYSYLNWHGLIVTLCKQGILTTIIILCMIRILLVQWYTLIMATYHDSCM